MTPNRTPALLLLLAGLIALPGSSFSAQGQWTYLGTVGASKIIPDSGEPSFDPIGLSTFHLIDYQFLPFASAGIAGGLEYYSTDLTPEGRVVLDYALLAGRLFLGGQGEGSRFAPYLLGGAGIQPKIIKPSVEGKNHLVAGLGFRYDFDGHPGGSGLDLLLLGTGRQPKSAGVRVGYSVSFGKVREKKAPDATPTPTPVVTEEVTAEEKVEARINVESEGNVVGGVSSVKADLGRPEAREFTYPSAIAQGLETGKFVELPLRPTKDQAVWDLAARKDVLGEPELYPILVDYNKDRIEDGRIAAGTPLVLPATVTPKMRRDARLNAWSQKYLPHRGRGINSATYAKHKRMKALIAKHGARTIRVPKGSNLWDMAGREDVYGDNWRYVDIYHANLDKLWDPDLVFPGMKLVLPDIPADQAFQGVSETVKDAAAIQAVEPTVIPASTPVPAAPEANAAPAVATPVTEAVTPVPTPSDPTEPQGTPTGPIFD